MLTRKSIRYSTETSNTDLVLKFELAGEKKEDVSLVSKNNQLVIRLKDKDLCYFYLEDLVYNSDLYDLNRVSASMNYGLLTIKIPQKKHVEKQISID